MSRRGGDLALLLLAGFRTMADRGAAELALLGYEDVRPAHDFALHSILAGADSASELGKAMSVSKQAAAKMIALLEARGYLTRLADPADKLRRRNVLIARSVAVTVRPKLASPLPINTIPQSAAGPRR